jgi:preprotein translocase subunit SecA
MKTDALLELKDQISEMVRLEIDSLVDGQFYQDKVLNEEGLETLANHILGLAPDIQLAGVFSFKLTELKEGIKKEMRNRDSAWVKEYLNTGFKKLLKAKEEEFASEYAMVIKALLFVAMDKLWMEHLETMADVRSGIGLQSYAQRNPLVEYKNIAYTEFEGLMDRIDTSVVNRLFKVARVERRESKKLDTNVEDVKDIDIGDREMNVGNDKLKDMVDKIAGSAKKRQAQADAASGKALAVHKKKVGRNDPCPCGSGKKYKKCHYPEFG